MAEDDDASSDDELIEWETARAILQEEMDADEQFDLAVDDFLSSDDEEANESNRKGVPNKARDFVAAHTQLVADYFNGKCSIYSDADFRRRFRLPREVFDSICERIEGKDPFILKEDALGKKGIWPLVKVTACLRYLAYGDAFDREDENLRIGESTLHKLTEDFCKMFVCEFGPQFLNRPPTFEERSNISHVMAEKGFPGCIASWDCKHFNWQNCPMRWAGQHQGHAEGGKKTLILEAIADHRKYIWQLNFGEAGSLNDLNVLDGSSIVGSMLNGTLDLNVQEYTLEGNTRDWCYFLVDGIYPEWSIFVNTYSNPAEQDKKSFAARQESVRKDIECAFGIVVQRFHILKRPLRNWYVEDITNIVHACVILHNMIVCHEEGEVGDPVQVQPDITGANLCLFGRSQVTAAQAAAEGVDLFAARSANLNNRMQSTYEHFKLKHDLVAHIDKLSNL